MKHGPYALSVGLGEENVTHHNWSDLFSCSPALSIETRKGTQVPPQDESIENDQSSLINGYKEILDLVGTFITGCSAPVLMFLL